MLELLYVELDDESTPHILLFTNTESISIYKFMPVMERIIDYIENEMGIKVKHLNSNLSVLRFVSRRDATLVKFRFDGTLISEWENG